MVTIGTDNNPIGTGQANSDKEVVSARLRKMAIDRNHNASSLSKAAGVSRPTMQKLWTGDRSINSEHLFKITDALDINPRWLITGLGNIDRPAEIDASNADDEMKLLYAFRRLGADQRKHVLENATMLLNLTHIKYGGTAGGGEKPATLHSKREDYRAPDTD